MSAEDDDEDMQHLSLVDNEIQEEAQVERLKKSVSKRSFWKNLVFQRKRSDVDEEPSEDDALLDTASNLDFQPRRGDDDELQNFRDDNNGLASSRWTDSHWQDQDDDNNSNSNNNNNNNNNSRHEDTHDFDTDIDRQVERSMSHRLLRLESNSDDDDDEEDEDDDNPKQSHYHANLLNLNASEPIIRYNAERESDGSDSENDDSDGDTSTDEEAEETERVAPLPPPSWRLKRSHSVASYSGYSDRHDSSSPMVDSKGRKNIQRRIEGFGSKADTSNHPRDTRTLKQRLLDFASNYRMRKMDIATEDSLQRMSWIERFDNAVDSVLPADPELEGYMDAFHVVGAKPIATTPTTTPTQTPEKRHNGNAASVISHRRQKLGNINDASYILHLERELQNKELELDSWKRRVKELEDQVKLLKGVGSKNEDDSSDSNSSNGVVEDEHESEIEWQTGGVAEEGVLIELGSPVDPKQKRELETHPSSQPTAISNSTSQTASNVSTFMMVDVPDSPGEDDGRPIFGKPLSDMTNSKLNTSPTDDGFPVLSSPRSHADTVWLDVSVSAQTMTTMSYKDSNSDKGIEQDFPKRKAEEVGEEADEGEDSDSEEDEDESSEEEDESSEEEKPEGTAEGILIELDTTTSKVLEVPQVAVVSDDDDDTHGDESGESTPAGADQALMSPTNVGAPGNLLDEGLSQDDALLPPITS